MTPSGRSDSGNPQPFDFTEARHAVRQASSNMIAAENNLRQAFTDAAHAEEAYRVALATEIARQHAEGVAWTVCQDMARGEKHVAHLRYLRDVQDGVKEAALQAMWRLTADRKDLGRLVDWSMRAAPYGQAEEEPAMVRRAA